MQSLVRGSALKPDNCVCFRVMRNMGDLVWPHMPLTDCTCIAMSGTRAGGCTTAASVLQIPAGMIPRNAIATDAASAQTTLAYTDGIWAARLLAWLYLLTIAPRGKTVF